MVLRRNLILSYIFAVQCIFNQQGPCCASRVLDDTSIDTLDTLRRTLQEVIKFKVNPSDTTEDSEGLTPLRQKAAMHVMSPDGEKRNEVKLPEPLDENSEEERVQEKQRLNKEKNVANTAEKRDNRIAEDELHQLLLDALCADRNGPDKQAECHMIEKRRYQIVLSRDKRKYSARTRQWEKGIVPYAFDKKLTETEEGKKVTIKAMKYIESISCVRFVEHTPGVHKQMGLNHTTYLNFVNKGDKRCWSRVGRAAKEKQDISACGDFYPASHEILHALGSEHEQARADRGKWIQILLGNIKSGHLRNFVRVRDTRSYGTKYDYGSIMHYSRFGFSKNGFPTIAIYDRDLRFLVGRRGLLSHEDVVALNRAYRCKAIKCPSFKDVCQNSGFVGYKDNRCQCICPNGLMGKTCEKTFKPGILPTEWPSGSYGLPQPASGCPSGSWETGRRYQTLNCCPKLTPGFHVKDETWGKEYFNHQFCMRGPGGSKTANWMPGKYCVYKKGECPKGFKVGSIKFDTVDNSENNSVMGQVPDGSYGVDTKFYYCCRNDGEVDIPIKLPISKPFYLFMSEDAKGCQSVEGTRFSKEYVKFPRGDNSTHAVEGHHAKLSRILRKFFKKFQLYYCYYEPMSYSCGGIITLTNYTSTQNIKSPNYPSTYDNNMECYWVIKSPPDTQIQVSMDDFDIEDDGKNVCVDSLEIRHHSIAQPGPRYCGSYFTRSFTSNYDSVMLIFRSSVAGVRKGFNAKVSIIKSPQYSCYNKSDLGRTYSGNVNYTRDYRKCIKWSAAANCPVSLWNTNIYMKDDHNYCRNPSGAEQPWCYVNATTCELDLCDVCGINVCYDRIAECGTRIRDGSNYCSTDAAFRDCHKTCGHCGKSMTKKVMSCPQPAAPLKASFVPASLKTSYKFGERIRYKCDSGLGVYGRVCLSDGTWSGSANFCAGCPSNWEPQGQSCFRRSQERATWDDAEGACKRLGTNLASPSNMQQQRVLESLTKYRSFWIGYNDKAVEGKWQWSDGSTHNFTLWEKGYPKTGTYGNCGAVNPIERGNENYRSWYDFPCDREKFYVCEGVIETCDDIANCRKLEAKYPDMCTKHRSYAASRCRRTCGFCGLGPNNMTTIQTPSTTATTPTSACLPGWILHGTTCYKLFKDKKPAAAAHQDCLDRGTQLIIVENKETNEFIQRWLKRENAQNTWMGLTDENHEGKWVWNSTGEVANYTGWYPGQPNNYKDKQHCAWFYRRRDYRWGEDVCLAPGYYICQTEQLKTTMAPTTLSPEGCPSGWINRGSSCYKLFNSQKKKAADAHQDCLDTGAYLVVIDNKEEDDFLRQWLKSKIVLNTWIGLTDEKEENKWVWKSTGKVPAYTGWRPGKPSTSYSQFKDCAVMDFLYSYKWTDVFCSSKAYYVCEIEAVTAKTTTAAPSTEVVASISTTVQATSAKTSTTLFPGACTSGWINHGISCYKLFNSEKKKAADANQDCSDRGGYLVVIDNKDEDDFLRQLLKRKVVPNSWIGLTDEKEENKWVWKNTGEVPTYIAWGSGRPSTTFSRFKDCAVMDSMDKYSWKDVLCFQKAYYICEAPATEVTTEALITSPITESPKTTKPTGLPTLTSTAGAPTSTLTTRPSTVAPSKEPAVSNTILFGHTARLRSHRDTWGHTSVIPEPDKKIGCSGFIVGWQVFFVQRKPVYLQIWRPQGKGRYELVEETYVPAHLGLTAINLDPSEQIPVQKGDVMGFYVSFTSPIPFDGQDCRKGHMIYNRKNSRYVFAGQAASFENKKAPWVPCRQYSFQALIKKDEESCAITREVGASRKKVSGFRRLVTEILGLRL